MSTPVYGTAIVGGGIVGLATAMECLAQFPNRSLIVLEKESRLAVHQTSRNSGVIHSGLYYRPGSLKARTCVAGAKLLVEFCQAHQIPYQMCGKLVVATKPAEVPLLQTLHQRGIANGVPGLSMIGPERLRELEPHARGVSALHVPSAGVVDYAAVAHAMATVIQSRGGTIRTSANVRGLVRREGVWVVETTAGKIQARWLVTCGGLQADRLARMAGAPADLQIVPFRGEYYELIPERRFLVRSMIYPVPNPALPFLGVHFTRSIHGVVHAGPNAVLALKREGYRKTDLDLRDALESLRFPGFWRMSQRYWATGLGELYRSLYKPAFVQALQRLVPDVRSKDLVPAPAGVRAQALGARGALLDDFDIVEGPQAIHVLNVPSPAATASLSIARTITERVAAALA